MGEVYNRGGDGGTPGVYAEGLHGAGGGSFGAAEWRSRAQGGSHAGDDGDRGAGGREQRQIAAAAERVADCGVTGEAGQDSLVLGGESAADRRSRASGRFDVSIAAADAG